MYRFIQSNQKVRAHTHTLRQIVELHIVPTVSLGEQRPGVLTSCMD